VRLFLGGRRLRLGCGLVALAVLMGCAVAPPPTVPPTTDLFLRLLAAGDVLAANARRTAAEEVYREAGAVRPADPAPHLRLARLYLDWNRPREGLMAAAAAERLGAPAASVAALRTALYAALDDWESVRAYGALAVSLNPSDVESRRRLAQAHLTLGHIEAARLQWEAVLRFAPDDALAHEALGVLLTISDPATGLPHLDAAGTPLAVDVRAVLSETTDDPAYRLARIGQVCLSYDRPALAAAALRRAVADNPGYADAHALLGQALERMGQSEEALDHLRRAVHLAPDSPLARSLLGSHLLRQGRPAEARPHLEVAYDLDPTNPVFCLYLAWLYADLGMYNAADLWIREAIRLSADDPRAMEAVARFCLERGLSRRGVEAARALMEMAPEGSEAYDLLGWALFLGGDPTGALERLERALEWDPDLASAYYHLGRVYTYLGQTERAREMLMRAQDINTNPALRALIDRALEEP